MISEHLLWYGLIALTLIIINFILLTIRINGLKKDVDEMRRDVFPWG